MFQFAGMCPLMCLLGIYIKKTVWPSLRKKLTPNWPHKDWDVKIVVSKWLEESTVEINIQKQHAKKKTFPFFPKNKKTVYSNSPSLIFHSTFSNFPQHLDKSCCHIGCQAFNETWEFFGHRGHLELWKISEKGPHHEFQAPSCFSKCWSSWSCFTSANRWKSDISDEPLVFAPQPMGSGPFQKNPSTPTCRNRPGKPRSSMSIFRCWMEGPVRSNLYQKKHIEKTESSIPELLCMFPFKKNHPPCDKKNSPSQQGHIDLAMANPRSWSTKKTMQSSPNLLDNSKIWELLLLFGFK